jgi:hypothetical protein
MRTIRLLSLPLLALLAAAMRADAQTCQGLSSFQDGKVRIGAEYRHSDADDMYREGLAFGVHDSWYASANIEEAQLSHANGSTTGASGAVGYQVHVAATPFQVCPEISAQYQSAPGANASTVGFGASLGYRLFIAEGFTLVPAAGIRFLSNHANYGVSIPGGSSAMGTTLMPLPSSEVFMAIGFVVNKQLTAWPTVRIPSGTGAKDVMGIGVSWNWSP